MYPILFEWNNIILPSWHFIFILATLSGYFIFQITIKHNHSPTEEKYAHNIFLISYISGYFGARALSILIEEDPISIYSFISSLFSFGSMTLYGALLTSFFCSLIYIKLNDQRLSIYYDAACPAILFGIGVGRIGCFLNGDDYGKAISTSPAPWWSVSFTNHETIVPRYPVQLIEFIACTMAASILFFMFKKLKKNMMPGNIGIMGTALYCIIRFFLEYLRGDDRGYFLKTTLSTSQGISLIILISSVIALYIKRKRINLDQHLQP